MEMRIWLKVVVISLFFTAGYMLPFITPTKVKFAHHPLPKVIESCIWNKKTCSSNHLQVTIYSGDFSPLSETVFGFYKSSVTIEEDKVFVTSDDQRFGVIEAQRNRDNKFTVSIPFCSNEQMRIVIFSEDTPAVLLPIK
jgi:hypothetical protein